MSEYIDNVIYAAIFLIFLFIHNKAYALYSKLKHYPTGVFSLPILGSILSLAMNLNRNPVHYFAKLSQKYGSVHTFWLGSEPVIVVNDYDVAKRLLNKSDFSDRYDEQLSVEVSNLLLEKANIVVMNYDEELKTLRKLSIEAIRKYLQTDNMAIHLREIVRETVNIMVEKEGGKGVFIPFKYTDGIFIRLLIRAAFVEKVAFDSPVINQIKKSFDIIQENFYKIFMGNYFPIIKLLHNKSAQYSVTKQTNELIRSWYHNSLKSYHSESSKTLSHLVNSAKLRYLSVKQNKLCEQYLSESNLIGTLVTLFFAGNDTTHHTFQWILLLLAYYPEMQRTMRDEVKCVIGDRFADSRDKERCHFVNAFICETIRFRYVVPLGAFHRTKYHTTIGEKAIPKGVKIVINQYFILNDPKYWTNPEIFNPKRFLNSDNCFDKTHLPAFIPFSTGKRMCIGDKFAMNTLFLTVVYLLQATNGYYISIPNRKISDLEPKIFGPFLEPKTYKIIINKD